MAKSETVLIRQLRKENEQCRQRHRQDQEEVKQCREEKMQYKREARQQGSN